MRNYILAIICLIYFGCESLLFQPQNEYNDNYKKGMNIFFMDYRNKYEKDDFEKNIIELKDVGVNSLFLIPYQFSKTEYSDSIFATKNTIPDSLLDSAIQCCKKHGIEVILKPHIDLLNGIPRTKISPAHPVIWSQQYISIISRYLKISEDNNLKIFVLGTELDKVVDKSIFKEIINYIRNNFSGELMYAASYDHFLSTKIWDYVDIIGINSHHNLSNKETCNISSLTESWNYWLNFISDFAELKRKNVIITEVGYCSKVGNAINPGDWTIGNKIDCEAQAKCYEALLIQANYFSKIKGIYWWQWELNQVGGIENCDYTPKDKPAEEILKKYWGS